MRGTAFRLSLFVTLALVGLAAPGFGLDAAAGTASERAGLVDQAYDYGLPAYEVARVRDQLIARGLRPNRFFHKRELSGPGDRLVTGPNTDTLYSVALLDLSGGPVRIDVPDTQDRYYSIAFIDAYTNNFAYVGRRTTGTRAGSYWLVGPDGNGASVSGPRVIRAPTRDVLLLVRIVLYGPDDLAAVHALQDRFVLAPTGAPLAREVAIAPVADDGPNFVAVVNQVLRDDPPPAADHPILDRIAQVGVGPAAGPLTAELRARWTRDFPAAQRALLASLGRADAGRLVDGWLYKPGDIGNFGTDYPARAAVALAGLFASAPQENLSATVRADDQGAPLDFHHRYRLRLPAEMPAKAFWSLSVRGVEPDGRAYIVDNSIHRYEISDRTPGLRRNTDGSLDIWIQQDPPPPDWRSNWLPVPNAPFRLAMRAYQPTEELLAGRFHYPPLRRTG